MNPNGEKPHLDAAKTLFEIKNSDVYLEALAQPTERPGRLKLGSHAVKIASETLYKDSMEGRKTETLDAFAFKIASLVPQYIIATDKLADLRQNGSTRNERVPFIKQLIEFNHTVLEMVDRNKQLEFSEVLNFINQISQDSFGEEISRQHESDVIETLRGVQHELNFKEMVLAYMPEFTVDDPTEDEDLNGSDLIFIFGDKRVGVDVKASRKLAEQARNKAEENRHDGSHIIWSGLSDEQFGPNFRVEPITLKRTASFVKEQILQAAA